MVGLLNTYYTVGWVDIVIGTKGKIRSVVPLENGKYKKDY
jgi:hypothetical protein